MCIGFTTKLNCAYSYYVHDRDAATCMILVYNGQTGVLIKQCLFQICGRRTW